MTRSLVLLPTSNEAAHLVAVVEALLRAIAADVLVRDDRSPDGPGQRSAALHARYPARVHVRHRPSYAVVVQMDAAFAHDPADLPRLTTALTDGAEVVLGSRYVRGGQTPGWPWRRRLLSGAGSRYAGAVLALPLREVTGGFKAFSRRALQHLDPVAGQASGCGIQIETTDRADRRGLTVREGPLIVRDRRAGASKLSTRIMVEAVLLPWRRRLRHWVRGRRRGMARDGGGRPVPLDSARHATLRPDGARGTGD